MSKPSWLRPPEGLDEKAAAHWKYYASGLYRQGYLRAETYQKFYLLCVLLAAQDSAAAALGTHGVTITAKSGTIKGNPALAALLAIEKRLTSLFVDFGLDQR